MSNDKMIKEVIDGDMTISDVPVVPVKPGSSHDLPITLAIVLIFIIVLIAFTIGFYIVYHDTNGD